MSTAEGSRSIERLKIAPLEKIAERNQVWSRMAAKYGVDNPATAVEVKSRRRL